ncbi:MAG TPA: PEP-CTERM sorting domain-containing protein [Terrimicrobiaceae bacterium]|nr:PEP-CTERM sorting domain-containing protein [Terrimicrobiaceae bacterium]
MKRCHFASRIRLFLAGISVLFAASGTRAGAAVIYLNNFGNNTGGIISLGTYDSETNTGIGWNVLRSQNGANTTNVSPTADARVGVNQGASRPNNAVNVNAPISLSNTNGIAYLSNGSGAGVIYTALFYTTQYTIDRSAYSVENFQWYANQSDAAGTTQQLAVQVGGSWYVTTTITPPNGSFGNFSTGAALQTVDFAAASWYSLTASLGSPFAIGGSSTILPGGNITGFGLYVNNGTVASNYSRFDTFTINASAVPEPSSVGLAGLALGIVLLRLRKRREA